VRSPVGRKRRTAASRSRRAGELAHMSGKDPEERDGLIAMPLDLLERNPSAAHSCGRGGAIFGRKGNRVRACWKK